MKRLNGQHRLLVVTESLGFGGTESHLIRLLPRLSAFGWEIAVFCLSGRGERAAQLEAVGVEVLSCYSSLEDRVVYRRDPLALMRTANQLFSLMRRWRPRVAHFYLPAPYLIGAPIAIAAGTPVKVMSRRSLADYQQRWPLSANWERKLHPRMDALVGNSRAVVVQLLSEGVPESKLKLIYNGVEISEPQSDRCEVRRELGLDARALIGVIVATLIPYKGHEDLIKGLGQVAPYLPSPWSVLVVGRDQGLRAKLEAMAQSEGIANNIQFLDQRADIPQLLAAADFGLSTSHEEGFSNVILEAMVAGLPMVATAVGGTPDAVMHERTGLLVPPRDPAAIGEAVLRLARNPKLRRTLGKAGRSRVEREFSIDRCACAHYDLYQELIARPSRVS